MRIASRTDLRMDPGSWARPGHAEGPELDLEPEQKAQVEKLKQIDQRVRAHEAAHLAAGGGLAMGGATYGYVQGPDGQRYATSGEVQIDTSSGKTPEETLEKARQIQRAALAPSDPSGQDRAVAAQAGAMMAQARQDLARQKADGGEGKHPLRGVWRPVDMQA